MTDKAERKWDKDMTQVKSERRGAEEQSLKPLCHVKKISNTFHLLQFLLKIDFTSRLPFAHHRL